MNRNKIAGFPNSREDAQDTVAVLSEQGLNPRRLAYSANETRQLLGGISLRTLRRLEQRGLLVPSRGLRTKLYSIKAIEQYLEETK